MDTTTSDWRTRFDAAFIQDKDPNDRVNGWLARDNGDGTLSIARPEDLKAFIEKEIERAREEQTRFMEQMIDKGNLKSFEAGHTAAIATMKEFIESNKQPYKAVDDSNSGDVADDAFAHGYNAALSDLTKLTTDTKH
jgi:hypothetical protein